MKDENSNKKPFFASFLEKQIKDPETVQGGGSTDNGIITAPSVDNVTAQVFDHVTCQAKIFW